MKPFNIILCLFFPCLAFILIGMFVPESGVAMIMTGVASMIWAVLTSLAAGIWFIARFTVPVILPLVGGVTIFKIKRALSEKPSRGDAACGITAAVSLLLIALSLNTGISLALLLGCVAMLLATGVLRTEPESPDEIKSIISAMCGVAGVGLFLVVLLNSGRDPVAENMYHVGDSVQKIQEDDVISLEKLEEISTRTGNRRVLFHEAVDMKPLSISDGVETMTVPGSTIFFTCSQGDMKNVSFKGMTDFTEALARRVCILRDRQADVKTSPGLNTENLYTPAWTPAQVADQDRYMPRLIVEDTSTNEEKQHQINLLSYEEDFNFSARRKVTEHSRTVISPLGDFWCQEGDLVKSPQDITGVTHALMKRYCVVSYQQFSVQR